MAAPRPPVAPMLAKPLGAHVPARGPKGQELRYEPKWDGFRCLLFVTDDSVVVQSRSGEDLAYAFPEVVAAAREALAPGCVLDGELVVAHEGRLWFERLGQRIRPRSEAGGWKIAELSRDFPAGFVAFDLLAADDEDLMQQPYRQRRERLESLDLRPPFHRTPATDDPAVASDWFRMFEGAGLDGVIAKPVAGVYEPGKRTMFKIKHARTADVVVAGWRAHKQAAADGTEAVGSLLLGLYDDAGRLHHVGVASSFTVARRAELARELAPLAADDDDHPWQAHAGAARVPGMQSRWSGGKDLSFHALRPELVAEVAYDHMEGDRFRHVAKLVRFRPDRDPASCTFGQLDRPTGYRLADVVPGLG
jgi:ATP-dependent DNA ligase